MYLITACESVFSSNTHLKSMNLWSTFLFVWVCYYQAVTLFQVLFQKLLSALKAPTSGIWVIFFTQYVCHCVLDQCSDSTTFQCNSFCPLILSLQRVEFYINASSSQLAQLSAVQNILLQQLVNLQLSPFVSFPTQDGGWASQEGLQPHWISETEVGLPWPAYCILLTNRCFLQHSQLRKMHSKLYITLSGNGEINYFFTDTL